MAHRSRSKLKTELKIKSYVLMTHCARSKLKTKLKIKCQAVSTKNENQVDFSIFLNLFYKIYFIL